MRKLIFILFVFCFSFSFSQEKLVSGFIKSDITFSSDTIYIIDFNTRISSEATLTILSGTNILFESGSTIIVDGGLEILGTNKNPVIISSKQVDLQGFGFVIEGHLGSDIIINNCIFKDLLIPISFKNEWFRENVEISNSTFSDINSQQSSINIHSLSQIYSTQCNFLFSMNRFVNNNSTIFINPLEDDALDLEFSYNLFHSNIMFANNKLNPLNSVLCGNYDQLEKRYKIRLFDNSFINNVFIPENDSLEIKEINFGITGTAETFEISENYMGEIKTVSDRLIHFYQNNKLPIVLMTNPSPSTSDSTPFHIWKIDVNSETIQNFNTDLILDERNTFTIYFNQNVKIKSIDCVDYLYFDKESKTIQSECITIDSIFFKGKSVSFNLNKNKIFDKKGCFLIPDFLSENNLPSSSFLFGETKLAYFNRYNLLDNYLQNLESSKEIEKEMTVLDEDKSDEKSKISYGISSGIMMYRGDIQSSKEELKLSYSMNFTYNFSENWNIKSSFVSGSISAKNKSLELNKFEFDSEILEFNVQLQHKMSQLKFFGITPFLSAGVSVFHFDPVASYNNYTYHLSDLRTENQEDKYSLYSFSIPYDIGVYFPVNKYINFYCFTSFRNTFTDDIDDVSNSYANYNEVLNDRGEVAAYFSDPSYYIDNVQKTGNRGNMYNNDSFFFFHFGINKSIR